MRDGPWKIIPGSEELFNLDEDLEELNNLWEVEGEVRERMIKELDRRVAEINLREKRTDEGRKGPHFC